MDSYVVRIYRRDINHPKNLVGLVEFVEGKQERAFTNFAELWAILEPQAGPYPEGEKNAQTDRK
jgi:hypothetical protein